MPNCNHCGRFINTTATGWMCGCEGERAAAASIARRLHKPRIVWDGRIKLWQCHRPLARYSGFGSTPAAAYEHFRTNNRR